MSSERIGDRAVPTIPTIPALSWTGVPGTAHVDGSSGALTLVAAPGVDWTNHALGGAQQHAATALAFAAPEEFTLAARVTVAGERTTFDAGALVIWSDRDHWAKLCFELSPQAEAMVVSVVTADGFSDDCNSSVVTAGSVYLRIVRTGPGWAFHESADGTTWRFVRLFRLGVLEQVAVGFLAQAPMGSSCTAVFDRITFSDAVPADLRDGS